jgi:hypothetical protein
MPTTSGYARDANRVPITRNGMVISSTDASFTANGAAIATPIFTVTGTVECLALWGIVTTAIGSNHTAAHWRINDQTIVTQVISAAAGTTLSSLPVGSTISRIGLVSTALAASTAATGLVTDPVAATAPDFFMPFIVVQKTASIKTDIEYVYTTNNTSLGAIKFYCGWVPLSDDGNVTAY